MIKYSERRNQVINDLKLFSEVVDLETRRQFEKYISTTLYKNIDEAISLICKYIIAQCKISHEMKKYLIGKRYGASLRASKNNIFGNYNIQKSDRIADCIGKDYGLSGASVCKYASYARAMDILSDMTSISTTDIMLSKTKLPVGDIIKLSKMSDSDIHYLKVLFHENFYKLAGYVVITGDRSAPRSQPRIIKNTEPALIKQMPKHDPDSMITSLTLTISSWIGFIQKTMSSSDIQIVSKEAKANLSNQITELKNIITETLKTLEEKKNE